MLSSKNGKILRIKTGYNPNSSSIGIDLTPLLIIGGLLSIVVPVISFIIFRRIKKKRGSK